MAIPLVVNEQVFNALSASTTTTLQSLNTNFQKCVSVVFEITNTGFVGTIDFQSNTPPNGTYKNVGWVELDVEDSDNTVITNNQIVYGGDTKTRRYLVPVAGVQFRVVMTAAAGTITLNAAGYGVYIPPNVGDSATTQVILNLTLTQLTSLGNTMDAILGELRKHTDGLTDIVGRDLEIVEPAQDLEETSRRPYSG